MTRFSCLWRLGGTALFALVLCAGAELAADVPKTQPAQKSKKQPPATTTPATQPGGLTVKPANPPPAPVAVNPPKTQPKIVSGQAFPALIGAGPPSFAGPIGYYQRYYGPNGPGFGQMTPLNPFAPTPYGNNPYGGYGYSQMPYGSGGYSPLATYGITPFSNPFSWSGY